MAILAQLAEVFEKSFIPYIDMMPEVDSLFDYQMRPGSAWAIPSDTHPVTSQNSLYAERAIKLLLPHESNE